MGLPRFLTASGQDDALTRGPVGRAFPHSLGGNQT